MSSILQAVSCLDDYDPDSLHVDTAKALTRDLVAPVDGTQRLFVRETLGRVLAQDVISPIDVPAHDNSAMDGYAVRAADLRPDGETRLKLVGSRLRRPALPWGRRNRKVRAHHDRRHRARCHRHHCHSGGGAHSTATKSSFRPASGRGRICAAPARTCGGHGGAARRAALVRPAELGLLASLGIAEVTVRRRVRVALFSTGDELVSIGTRPRAGEIFDSNRYTLYGMLTRLGCDVLDMGVVRDDPEALEAALVQASRNADAIITSGGVSVGEADFIRGLMARLGEVLFWKIAMKPGRPMAFGRIGGAYLFGLPGNPVAVMVTFYQFVREALLKMMGVDPVAPLPLLQVPCVTPLKKSPGRTEFQRGILFREKGRWQVRASGAQGSGILRSMSEANCFIVLEHERGSVNPGDAVSVQVMEGLV